jgi:hypothetical protein
LDVVYAGGLAPLDNVRLHPVAPAARLDCAGLLILLGSATVHGVDRRVVS